MTLRLCLALAVLPLLAVSASASTFLGSTWPSGTVTVQLQLDATAPHRLFPLQDASTNWNSVAESAVAEWNGVLIRTQLVARRSSATDLAFDDEVNQVVFGSSAYGMDLPTGFAAVTYVAPLDNEATQVRTVEADIIVNPTYSWNSYRGAVRSGLYDLRRVLLHELGHLLGLGHPDQAKPAQFVSAIMNSTGGNVDTLQGDDRSGVGMLYDVAPVRPVVTMQPLSQAVAAGTGVTLTVAIDGTVPAGNEPFRSYRWFFRPPGGSSFESLRATSYSGRLEFRLAQPLDSGSYFYRAYTADHTVDSEIATLTVSSVPTQASTTLSNLSTRGQTFPGPGSMMVGFTVAGTKSKRVLIRSVGASLRNPPFSIADGLRDPLLYLNNLQLPVPLVATSPLRWDLAPDAAAVRDASARVGAFPLVPGAGDAVILTTLPPGNYTAQTVSVSGAPGSVIVEVYDVDSDPGADSRLTNLSTRGYVDVGDKRMIAGFVVRGAGPRSYLIRVAGDTLNELRVTDTLDDPYLELYRGDGLLVRENDDLDIPLANWPALQAAAARVGAFPLNDRQECSMIVTLAPGNYTAHVRAFESTRSSPRGIALIELYELEPAP